MTITYRDTKGEDLDPFEVDANFRHVLDSANGTFVQSGSAARGTVAAALNDICINVKSAPFNALGNGVADDTAAIQAALTYAASISDVQRPAVYMPGGRYLVSASLNVTAPMQIYGAGNGTQILPSISDGTPVFNFSAMQRPKLSDFVIAASTDQTNFIAGTANGQNCIGIKFNSTVDRWAIDNVRIYGLKTGANLTGFIGTAINFWFECCETGLIGDTMNSVHLNLRMENNRKDYAITNSNAVTFAQPLYEGDAAVAVSATLDGCHGVSYLTPYFEWASGRNAPYVTIGGTTECTQVEMSKGSVAGLMGYGVYPISLDRVDGVDIDCYFATGDRNVSVLTTANTKNYWLNGTQDSKSIGFHDASNTLGPCFNYFPNRNFDIWFRGWGAVGKARCATAQETTIVRKGANALRITPTAAQTNNNAVWQLSGPAATYLRNKTIRAYAWIWVPNILAYDESVAAGARQLPALYIGDYDGANAQTSATRNTGYKKGAWNFMESDVITVQNDATRIDLTIYTNNNGAINADGSEYIVVDAVYIVESSTPFSRVLNDDVLDSPFIDAIGVAGRMIYYADSAPADANQVYAQGDRVHKLTPAAAASPGWVCTTAGAGGVAVFKAEAAVAA